MKGRELLIYLHSINGVGKKTLEKIVSFLDNIEEVLILQPLELSMKTGINYKTAESIIEKLDQQYIDAFHKHLKDWEYRGIKIITYLDEEYPEMLREIHDRPFVLYAMGDLNLLKQKSIAIVGTRNPSQYGIITTEHLAKELVRYGWVITSGMARGIDRSAHHGALEQNAKTIAVLGSGIDVVYPRENKTLYQEIVKNGLVISEYPPGTTPHPSYFPNRNRLISGLSYGTLVIEASIKSGSLITAQFALEQSREVFAVPGAITSKKSIGTNSLIKQGAKLVQDANDINEEFPYLQFVKENGKTTKGTLSEIEKEVYHFIQYEPIHIDELFSQLSVTLSVLYETLLTLQLKGNIKQLQGSLYIRND